MFWRAWIYFGYLVVIWTIFRYFSQLPEVVEEMWFKTIIWLVPLFWLNFFSKKRIKFFEGGVLRAVIWGGGVGLLYGSMFLVLGGQVDLSLGVEVIGLSLVTVVVENLVFVGFLLPAFMEKLGVWKSMLLTAFLFGVIHIPIALFSYRLDWGMLLYLFWMMGLLGLINSWLRLRTNNVGAAIVSSWVWSVLVRLVIF